MPQSDRQRPRYVSQQPTCAAITPRGLSRREAAYFAGLSPTAFDRARRQGKYPDPTLPGGRYDRILLEGVMDRHSGIKGSEESVSALDKWRADRAAGSL